MAKSKRKTYNCEGEVEYKIYSPPFKYAGRSYKRDGYNVRWETKKGESLIMHGDDLTQLFDGTIKVALDNGKVTPAEDFVLYKQGSALLMMTLRHFEEHYGNN